MRPELCFTLTVLFSTTVDSNGFYPLRPQYGYNVFSSTPDQSYIYQQALQQAVGSNRYNNPLIVGYPVTGNPYGGYVVVQDSPGLVKIFMLPPFPPFIEPFIGQIQNYFSTFNEYPLPPADNDTDGEGVEEVEHDPVDEEEDEEEEEKETEDANKPSDDPRKDEEEFTTAESTTTSEDKNNTEATGDESTEKTTVPDIMDTKQKAKKDKPRRPGGVKPPLLSSSNPNYGPYIVPEREAVVIEAAPVQQPYYDYRYVPLPLQLYDPFPEYYRVPGY